MFYGILRRGAVAVPMNPLLKAREIEFYLTNTAAVALFATPMFADEARAAAEAAGARLGSSTTPIWRRCSPTCPRRPSRSSAPATTPPSILHTSGTTGKPKGAELTHAGLAGNAEVTARTLMQIGPDDVVMGCLPLFHVFGLTCGLNASVLVGATLTLVPRFDPRSRARGDRPRQGHRLRGRADHVCRDARRRRRVPAEATASLRVCVSGGASLPVQVLTDFEKTFDAMILEGYGLSETSPVASFNHPEPRPQGRLDRHPDRGGADAGGRRRRRRGRGRASPARSRSRDRTS